MRCYNEKVKFDEKYVKTIRMIDKKVKKDRYRVEERESKLPEIVL